MIEVDHLTHQLKMMSTCRRKSIIKSLESEHGKIRMACLIESTLKKGAEPSIPSRVWSGSDVPGLDFRSSLGLVLQWLEPNRTGSWLG